MTNNLKTFIVVLLCGAVMVSCKTKSGEETTSTDSTAVANATSTEPHNRWIIPLTDSWKDPVHFVLLLPNSSGKFDFWKDPAITKYSQVIGDTAQGKFSTTKDGIGNCGQRTFYEIQLDRGGDRSHGWVTEGNLLLIGDKELGEYVIGDRKLKLATMKPRENSMDGDCSFLHTLFFYNEKYLYLIDASKVEEVLRLQNESHLTVLSQMPNASFNGKQRGNDFVITWGEPNMRVEIVVTWDNNHLKYVSHELKPMESDVDDLEVEETTEAARETKTEICSFKYAGAGDCFHLEFSCGDFGNADYSKLTGEELALWESLSVEDANGESAANPKYLGKNFEITYYYVTGEICGYYGETETSSTVQLITSFKLKN